MKSFDIYVKNGTVNKAVKRGWSWPAFFFGSVWALCVRLWLLGLLLLPVELLLTFLARINDEILRNASGNYAETVSLVGGLISLVFLAIRILFGGFGNAWKRKALERKGFQHAKLVKASDKKEALSPSLVAGINPSSLRAEAKSGRIDQVG